MAEDKIKFAKDLVASNISKANKKENSPSNKDDISKIKETNQAIRQIERKRAAKVAHLIQQTSMQAILAAEQDMLLRAAKRNAEQYADSELAVKDKLLNYRGLILLKSEWHPEQNKDVLSYMKTKVRLIDNLQEKTLYDGQPEYYRQMQ